MSIEPTGNRVPEWTLGERLRKSRGDAELEQQELADRIGASRQSISNWETGKNRPRLYVMRSWALATGVPLWWLKGESAPPVHGPTGYPIRPVTSLLDRLRSRSDGASDFRLVA